MTTFYAVLQRETADEQAYMYDAPIFSRCFAGDITLEEYRRFLTCAYHHVKHTVPLIMSMGAGLPDSKEWLREASAHYIEEEIGHQEWILNDIAACGFDKESTRHSKANLPTELMVSYAYDTINRVNPIGLLGMIFVLEGTSISVADKAAEAIQNALGLPNKAFSYLRSHGALDQEHIVFFQSLVNQLAAPEEQTLVIHCARRFYHLYGDIFRSIPVAEDQANAA
ncbi:iron-containing redox enzyme family protein [Aurantivibrio plasticivorans]